MFIGLDRKVNKCGQIFIHQSFYTESILKRFSMINAKPISIPLDINNKLILSNNNDIYNKDFPFRETIENFLQTYLDQI